MIAGHLSPHFRFLLILGVLCYCTVIFLMLKKKKLSIQYSIIWLFSAGFLLIFALFPYLVLVIRQWVQIENIANLIFLGAITFLLLMCLSLSSIASSHAEKIRKMAQQQALLERRVRELEQQQKDKQS